MSFSICSRGDPVVTANEAHHVSITGEIDEIVDVGFREVAQDHPLGFKNDLPRSSPDWAVVRTGSVGNVSVAGAWAGSYRFS